MCYFVQRIQRQRRKRIRIKSTHGGKIKHFKMSVKKKTIAHTLLQYHCQHIIINRPNQQLLDYTMASKENGARVIYFIRFHSNGRPAHVGLL